jgi:hypothetical protein
MALAASLRLNCAKAGLTARVKSDARAKPREIFIQTSSMNTARQWAAQNCAFDL